MVLALQSYGSFEITGSMSVLARRPVANRHRSTVLLNFATNATAPKINEPAPTQLMNPIDSHSPNLSGGRPVSKCWRPISLHFE